MKNKTIPFTPVKIWKRFNCSESSVLTALNFVEFTDLNSVSKTFKYLAIELIIESQPVSF